MYMAGLIEDDVDVDLVAAFCPPVVGIASSTSGYSVFEANVELLEVKLHDGLSEEAALTRIEALQNITTHGPLYVHSSVRDHQRRPQSGYGRAPSEAGKSGSSAGLLGASCVVIDPPLLPLHALGPNQNFCVGGGHVVGPRGWPRG